MKVVGPLTSQDPLHWALMPYLLERVERFCADFPTDLLPEQLREFIISGFRTKTIGAMAAIVVINDHGVVVGHGLASIELRRRDKVGFVVQYQVDRFVPRYIREEIMRILRAWAKDQGAVALEAITWLPPKVLERYGFTHYRTMMRAPLEDPHGERS